MSKLATGAVFGGLAAGAGAARRAWRTASPVDPATAPADAAAVEAVPEPSVASSVAKGVVGGALSGGLVGRVIGRRNRERVAELAGEVADQSVAQGKRLVSQAKPVLAGALDRAADGLQEVGHMVSDSVIPTVVGAITTSFDAAQHAAADLASAARPATEAAAGAVRARETTGAA